MIESKRIIYWTQFNPALTFWASIANVLRRSGDAGKYAAERDQGVNNLKTLWCRGAMVAIVLLMLGVILASGPRCYAQTQAQTDAQTKAAKLQESGQPSRESSADVGSTTSEAPARPAAESNPAVPAAVANELAALKARIEQLELQLKRNAAPEQPSTAVAGPLAKTSEPAPTAEMVTDQT